MSMVTVNQTPWQLLLWLVSIAIIQAVIFRGPNDSCHCSQPGLFYANARVIRGSYHGSQLSNNKSITIEQITLQDSPWLNSIKRLDHRWHHGADTPISGKPPAIVPTISFDHVLHDTFEQVPKSTRQEWNRKYGAYARQDGLRGMIHSIADNILHKPFSIHVYLRILHADSSSSSVASLHSNSSLNDQLQIGEEQISRLNEKQTADFQFCYRSQTGFQNQQHEGPCLRLVYHLIHPQQGAQLEGLEKRLSEALGNQRDLKAALRAEYNSKYKGANVLYIYDACSRKNPVSDQQFSPSENHLLNSELFFFVEVCAKWDRIMNREESLIWKKATVFDEIDRIAHQVYFPETDSWSREELFGLDVERQEQLSLPALPIAGKVNVQITPYIAHQGTATWVAKINVKAIHERLQEVTPEAQHLFVSMTDPSLRCSICSFAIGKAIRYRQCSIGNITDPSHAVPDVKSGCKSSLSSWYIDGKDLVQALVPEAQTELNDEMPENKRYGWWFRSSRHVSIYVMDLDDEAVSFRNESIEDSDAGYFATSDVAVVLHRPNEHISKLERKILKAYMELTLGVRYDGLLSGNNAASAAVSIPILPVRNTMTAVMTTALLTQGFLRLTSTLKFLAAHNVQLDRILSFDQWESCDQRFNVLMFKARKCREVFESGALETSLMVAFSLIFDVEAANSILSTDLMRDVRQYIPDRTKNKLRTNLTAFSKYGVQASGASYKRRSRHSSTSSTSSSRHLILIGFVVVGIIFVGCVLLFFWYKQVEKRRLDQKIK